MTAKLNIALIDDHKFILDLLEMYLESTEYKIALKSSNSKELMNMNLEPYLLDFIILDINMPDISGFDLLNHFVNTYPKVKIIILSSISDMKLINLCLKSGASAYINKDSIANELLIAFEHILNGKIFLCSGTLKLFALNSEDINPIEQLSYREIEIIKHIIDDFSASEIAEKLHLSPRTVDNHRNKIYAKLDINNKASLVKYFYTSGLSKLFE